MDRVGSLPIAAVEGGCFMGVFISDMLKILEIKYDNDITKKTAKIHKVNLGRFCPMRLYFLEGDRIGSLGNCSMRCSASCITHRDVGNAEK
jgi:hypothetical protein